MTTSTDMNKEFLNEVQKHDQNCQCCERKLDPNRIVWLVRDDDNDSYHKDDAEIPVDHQNTGWFPFGIACSKRVLKAGGRIINPPFKRK
jgi:hypothetical protein